MIDTGQKFLSAPSALMKVTFRSRSQTKNLNVKVFIKDFKTSLFPNLITDLIHLWFDDTYWSKILPSSVLNPLVHVKVKVTVVKIYMSKFNVNFQDLITFKPNNGFNLYLVS